MQLQSLPGTGTSTPSTRTSFTACAPPVLVTGTVRGPGTWYQVLSTCILYRPAWDLGRKHGITADDLRIPMSVSEPFHVLPLRILLCDLCCLTQWCQLLHNIRILD